MASEYTQPDAEGYEKDTVIVIRSDHIKETWSKATFDVSAGGVLRIYGTVKPFLIGCYSATGWIRVTST